MQATRKINENKFVWQSHDAFFLVIYLVLLLIAFLNLPKQIWQFSDTKAGLLGFGFIGFWRYGWWFNHFLRALIYTYLVFPKRRARADKLWESGWRPERLFFMMTTYKENPETTKSVLQSLVDECHTLQIPIYLFIGIGAESDKAIIRDFFSKLKMSYPFSVTLIDQTRPGKRYAIGETLRSMINHDLKAEDLVVFLDGDTIFSERCLIKCLPFFPLFPKLQALTTNEETRLIQGPWWIKKWLEMRFTQRNFVMRSHSLSNKVLTLTGRMSIFRAQHILEPEFIAIIEEDKLTHWLWGDFRFLSGDDKSTWYYLLKAKADMFYIHDALTITVESIHGNGIDRMKENLLRWSGNTLRNGIRAIALGPRHVGFFIWWCLIDQRITVWTMLMGFMITFVFAFTKSYAFIILMVIWISLSRICLSSILFFFRGRVDFSYPFLLYVNQLATSIVKLYMIFRLPQQRWKNRGSLQLGFAEDNLRYKNYTANFLILFYCLLLFICILLYLNKISLPCWSDFITSL